MDIWTDCHCARQHATARGFLRCKVKRHTLIGGGGPYALIAWCTPVPTVTLWPTADEAERRHRRLTNGWCGPGCRYAHQLVASHSTDPRQPGAYNPTDPRGLTMTNHYNPSFQHAALRDRPTAWDCIPAAYQAVGLEPPTKPTADILGALASKDKPSDILDTLEARFLNGNDGPELADEYRQAWLDATFYEAASKRLHAAQNTIRNRRLTESGIRLALKTLAPEVDKLAARLTAAAIRLHPAAPLDQLAAHETGTVAEVGQVFDIGTALSVVASLHDRPELPSLPGMQSLGHASGLLKFLPVLHLPPTGYPEPGSVEEVAAGVGLEPEQGRTSVVALIEAANHGADELLLNVARGRYPSVTIRLAETPQELAKRVQRVVDAVTSKAYTYERAQAHRTGMFTGAGQRIDQWAIYVLAHHAGVAPEMVTAERAAPLEARG